MRFVVGERAALSGDVVHQSSSSGVLQSRSPDRKSLSEIHIYSSGTHYIRFGQQSTYYRLVTKIESTAKYQHLLVWGSRIG